MTYEEKTWPFKENYWQRPLVEQLGLTTWGTENIVFRDFKRNIELSDFTKEDYPFVMAQITAEKLFNK